MKTLRDVFEAKFNPYHNAHTGQFTSGPGTAYGSLSSLSSEQQTLISASMTKKGIDFATGVSNGSALLEDAQRSGVYNAAKDWYQEANAKTAALAKETGLTLEQAAGGVAALSPQTAWNIKRSDGTVHYDNLEYAKATALAVKTNPTIEINQGLVTGLAKYEKYTNFSTLIGQKRKLNDLTPIQAAYILSPLMRSYPANIAKAIRIYKGERPDAVLGGAKVRSFFSNIMWPNEKSGVTIDTWMLRELSGKKAFTSKELHGLITSPTSKGLGGVGSYPYFAEMINTIAEKYHILPQQAQAIIWTESRRQEGNSNVATIEQI